MTRQPQQVTIEQGLQRFRCLQALVQCSLTLLQCRDAPRKYRFEQSQEFDTLMQ